MKQRNTLHDHPLMRKGGAHQKTRKVQRRDRKQELRRDLQSNPRGSNYV